MFDFIEDWIRNPVLKVIVGVIAIAVIIALVIAGAGLLSSILLVFLMALGIYFGSIRELIGSAVLAGLLNVIGPNIKQFVNIWFVSPQVDKFFELTQETSLFVLMLVLFFFFYLLSFTTGCIRLLKFSNSTTVESKKED